jgi:hypothetical protein
MIGVGTLLAGAVLVGTGLTVSARTVPLASAAQANKKKPTTTTTTTTTTTIPTSTTTTQPCSPTSLTVPSGSESITADPDTCIEPGTVVTLTGSGLPHSNIAAFLQCNDDPNQPTVLDEGNQVPIGCSNPVVKADGRPGLVVTTSTGTISVTFTIVGGTVGPPCGPSSCTGAAATDSSGGSPFTDAVNYPCPPTPAQAGLTPADICNIQFGDAAGDNITIPLTFNPNTPPQSTAPETPTPAATATTVAPAKTAAKSAATAASSSSLAFTGTGPGLWWLALVGVILMALGTLALVVVDEPRRLVRLVVTRVSRTKPDSP